jgi:hypothetical protein
MAGEWELRSRSKDEAKDLIVARSTAGPLPCSSPHCVFKAVFLLLGNTASKIRTVKHLQVYPLSLQNMSVDALSR